MFSSDSFDEKSSRPIALEELQGEELLYGD